jgi:spore germination protein GerM
MTMRALLPLLIAASLCLAGCSCSDDGGVVTEDAAVAEEAAAAPEESGTAQTPLPSSTVEIYFPSAERDGLVAEYREIFDTSGPSDRVKQIVADLISGPESRNALRALPPATRLRQAYVLENGVAYLDFSAGLKEGIGGGSMEEILAVYAIVNSIVANIPEVRRVGILVNGRVLATLNGHLDLRRPLPPDYSLILGSIIVSTGCGAWTHAA